MYCPKCGTQAHEDLIFCRRCGATLRADVELLAATPAETPAPRLERARAVATGFNLEFLLFAGLLTLSLIATVLFVRNADNDYDDSAACVLDPEYTEVTRTSGSTKTVSYEVNYHFAASGGMYSGTDTIFERPSNAEAIVYFDKSNPQDNGLHRSRLKKQSLIFAAVSLVVAFLAYWKVPGDYRTRRSIVQPGGDSATGDFEGEFLRIERGKYDARLYVALAFFGQIAAGAALVAYALAATFGDEPTSVLVLSLATGTAVVSTLWVYSDRWRCIEAYSSQFCSGIANFSMFYVPIVSLVYANYRAALRLRGR